MLLPDVAATRVLRADRRGSSWPVIVETADGLSFVKLRGAAQGTASLVAEVIVAALADRLGLPVPSRRVVTFPPGIPTDDRNDELADLLHASTGENLGFEYLEPGRPFQSSDMGLVSPDFASQVCWLDWLVLNPDRTPRNPNILVQGRRLWLIDHGAALPFQHNWTAVSEATPHRLWSVSGHVLAAAATRLRDWDPILTALLPRAALTDAVAQVPVSFLRPMLPDQADADRIERRRMAYEAFLWKRLRGSHTFEAVGAADPVVP